MVQFGIVEGSTNVTVNGGTVHTNVYGGGSYAAVGVITAERITQYEDNGIKYDFRHMISEGTTNVTISGGTIGPEAVSSSDGSVGNVFGGGMGEPNLVTTGSVGEKTEVFISGGIVTGNVYGGGENGFVGKSAVDISDHTSKIIIGTFEGGVNTYSYDVRIVEPDGDPIGSTNVTISGGIIGIDSSSGGNVFGAGKGASATVVKSSTVKISSDSSTVTINGNVYGGGELGLVGALLELNMSGSAGEQEFKFTVGSTNVIISGNTEIKGNVFGGGKGEDETETTDTSLNAIILGSVTGSTNVEISGNVKIGTIDDSISEDAGNVYGGGELGIVGIYHDNGSIRTYEGGSSTLIIKGGTIYSVVYGGGKGTVNNVLSGAVGNAATIISGNTEIMGNVYGGGAYSIVGGTSVTIDKASTAPIDSEKRLDPRITAAENDGRVDVIILGGKVIPINYVGSEGDPALTSSVGNVFGGGYGPKATVAGSTYVYIGKQTTDNNTLNGLINGIDQSNITIFGNIFGGGDMGSIGFDANTSQKDVSDFGKDYNTLSVSSNIFIETSNPKIMIGGIPENNTVGNIYAGGRGGDLIHMISDDPEKYETLKGYAIVHGNSNLSIKCSGSGTISVTGSIYGAGQGNPKVTNSGEIGVILYAAVTGNTSIRISNADVNNIYGGGQLSILGYYHDDDTSPLLTGLSTSSGTGNYRHYYGTDTKIIINKSRVSGSVYGGGYGTTANAISGAVGESTVIIGGGSKVSGSVYGGGNYAAVSDQLVVNKNSVDNNGKINPTIIASNNISKAIVVILDAEISKSVYGGGYGPRAVVAGSTYVFIGVSGNESYPSDLIGNMDSKYRADVKGSIYGGGNMGSVGFIMELEGSENKDSFPTGYQPISVSSNVILSLNGDADNRIIVGDDVYGGGRGGDLYIPYEGNPTDIKPDNWDMNPGRVLYGYAVVHGQSNVSITGSYAPSREGQSINITNNVFGGGEGMESSDGQSLDIIVYAAVTDTSSVNISNAHITGNIYGGGNLGVVGYFIDSEDASSKILREFTGKDSNVTINASFIEGTVFGGGRGTITNILSGAVGNTKVVIKGEETSREISPASTVTGSVYGGGAYALIGSMGITIDVIDNVKSSPVVTSCRNDSKTSVIILNSTIGSETKSGSYGSGNVFGGGYGPRAVIAGSTEVCIGSNATLASSVTINGSVYGGGNMGSIGVIPGVFSFEKIDDYSQVNSNLEAYNNNIKDDNTGNKRITADVKVVINNESDTIHIKGSVYGGGQGGDLTTGPNGEEINLKGYAVVYGTTDVEIHGISSDSKSKLVIDGNVYGGGLGSNTGVQSIQYAEIYDSANVSITYAEIKGNIYGGGDLGIIGHFTDSTANDVKTLSDSKHVWVIERDFCGDAIYFNENDKPELDYNDNGYKGRASTTVTITDSSVSGSVYGGGKGRGGNGNILSGAVGRETNVTVNSGTIGGNVYGGGEFGIVGSTTTQLIMITPGDENPFDGINIDTTTAASVIVNIPHLNLNSSGIIEKNLDIQNDICSRVNIYGGTISGSIYGAGKGENLNPLHVWTEKGINKADYQSVQGTTAYNKLSIIGRTEVNISNGIINKHVYGGSENGDVGGFSILKSLMQYLYDTNQNIDLKVIANLDDTTRDNNTYEVNKESKNILNYQFSASFVNIVGGTIHGNVFGGGYFGAIYGNTHVHIGWNSVMPYDDNSNGECHYYNNYGDDNYAGKGRPFDITEGSGKNKADYVHDLFINGTVFAGGDRGDPSATTINYDYISVYGSSHIFVNGTGYATGTNTSGETKAMYIQGSLFGSGNSCTTFYSDKDMTRFITIRNYNAINDQNQFIIYSIQRATNVTLVNSSLRLPGRSDGSNVNKTALYSLNHVISLTLQGGSEIILDSVVQDLRSIYSKDGTGADTAQNNALNTIKLNNGITLIIKTEKGLGSVTSPNPALSDEPELWPDGEFGKVTGYFFLDLSDTSYYTAYVYGSLESQGGFTYGNSFGSLSGTKVPHEDFEKDSEGYRAWHPIGGGHLSASSTIVADTDNKPGSEYVNYGKIVLPMTEAGAKFKLIGYDIYPAQAASLNDDRASLRLIGENVSFGNSDVNRFFKLKAVLGNGFTSDNLGESAIWLTSDKGDSTIPGREFIATGGATLPEIDLELHSAGVTQTTTAGYVVLLIQESIPVLDENGNQLIDDKGEKIYTPGNEISAIVNIETQAAGFGATKDNKNYENDMNLYATKEGEYSWNMSISNINDDKYRFELTNVTATNGINLVSNANDVNSKDKYTIRMNHSLNNDNSTGWDGFSFEEFALKAGNQKIFLGETDGRFNTSFQFIINNLKDSSGYAKGTVTLTISYYKISTAAKASEEPVLADNTTPDGTIQIEIYVGELKPWYNVKFVPAPGEPDAGVGAVATQQITHGDVADKPTPDPSRQDNKYSFGGWYRTYTDASEQKYSDPYSFDDNDPSAVITADTTLYGKWVSSVTFNYNYDNCPNPITVRLSDKEGTLGSNMPQNPVRAGYTFDRWSTSETGTADFTGDTRVSQNTTVYAKWTSNDYTVFFTANKPTDYGGEITVPTDDGKYKVGDTIDLKGKSPTPIKLELVGKQYDFKGWSVSKDAVTGSTESIKLTDEIIKSAEKGVITFNAVWVESTLHTVTLTTNHPAAGKYVSFEYYTENATEKPTWIPITNGAFTVADGTNVNIRFIKEIPNSNNTYPGYLFGNWSVTGSNANNTSLETLSFTVTADSGVTLNLTPSQITVTLELNGGTLASSTNPITVTFGEGYSTLPASNPTKLGYTFKGWYTAQSNGSEVTSSTEVTNPQPHTLYAIWDPVTYNIVLHDGANTGMQSFNNYTSGGMSVQLISNPFKNMDGKIFKGWAKTSSSTTVEYSDKGSVKIMDEDIKKADTNADKVALDLYAIWENPDLTLSFTKNGNPVTSVIFDGYNWSPRIAALSGEGIEITITALQNGSSFTFKDTDNIKYEWTDQNGDIISSDGMVHKGIYNLKLTCSRTESGVTTEYKGEASLEILPFTYTLGVILSPNNYTYNGLQPNILDPKNISVFIYKNDDKQYTGGEYKLSWNEITNYFDIIFKKNNNVVTNYTDADTYGIFLNAKNKADSDYHSNVSNSGASGSSTFTIDPLRITIIPDANQWKYYGDDLGYIYTGMNDAATQNNNKIQYKVTANINGVNTELVIGGVGYENYTELSGDLGLADANNVAVCDIVFANEGTYTISLGTLINDATNNKNPNYTISLSKPPVKFEIKKLPIIIKPDENQWKYYGDPNNQIHKTDVGDPISDLGEISYTVSATINGESSEWKTLNAWNEDYAPNDLSKRTPLSGIRVSYDGSENQFKDVGEYDTTVSSSGNTNYDISIYADNSGNKIKFEVKKLPVVIVPLSGQYKYYVPTDFSGNLKIYMYKTDSTPDFIGSSLGFNTYDFRDTNRNTPLTFTNETTPGYALINGELQSDMLRKGADVRSDYLITQGTVTDANNTNYVINYIKYNQTPVLQSASILGANENEVFGAVMQSSTSITITNNQNSYVYTGQPLNTGSWTIVVCDTDNNIDIQTGTSGNLVINYSYSSDGTTWTDGLPTNVGTYEVKVYTEGNEKYKPSEATVNVSITKVQVMITPTPEYTWNTGTSHIKKTFDWTISAPNSVTNIFNNNYYSITSSEGGADISGHITISSARYDQSDVNYNGSDIAAVKLTVSFSLDDTNNFNLTTLSIELNGMINPNDLTDSMIETISKQHYHGEAVTPSIIVKDGDHTLAVGKDYSTPTYTSNTGAGTGNVSINGIGNFKGTAKASFDIENQPYTLSGYITGGSNNKISGAVVTVSGSGILSSEFTTGNDGRYIFQDIPYGTELSIKISAAGYGESNITIPSSDYPKTETDGEYKLTKDIELTPIDYNITYYDGSSEITTLSPDTYNIENGATLPTTSKTGYTFGGWYEDLTFTGTAVSEIAKGSTGNKTLYAKWDANTNTPYKVEHYQQNTSGDEYTLFETTDHTGTTGNDAELGIKSYTGFTNNTSKNPTDLKIGADGKSVFKVYYDRNTHEVTFNSKEGSSVSGITGVRYGATFSEPTPAPTKEGYTFKGWFTSDDSGVTLGTEWNFSLNTMPDSNLTLYAKFTENSNITINYVAGTGGSVSSDSESIAPATGTASGSTATANAGYTFAGWYSDSGFSTSVSTDATFTPSKNSDGIYEAATFYAKFALETLEYTVTFESNGGSEISSVDVASGEKVTKPADPTRSGYEFKGWYKEDGTEWNFDKDVVTADITLYAKWEPKDEPTPTIYKVEYNANGGEGEVPKAELHFAGEFVTVKSADLRKNGYIFKGWCDSVTQTTYQPDEKFRMPSRDVCLTAVWESDPISGKEVSVTFIVDNEVYGISSTHIHTALNGAMQADPVKEGFDFLGWYTKEGEVFTANTIVNDDMTVYAKFELNEDYVLVTYIIDNEIYMTLACKKTKIIEPNVSAGISKELNGWYTDKELKNKFDFNSVIEEDSLTLYAEWKNNSNFMILFIFALFAGFMAAVIASTKRISFYENKNDEEKYASVIIIGKGTLKDRLPSHSSSNFEGWYSESGELITEDTEITQSMKVYAHWKH